MKCSILIGSRQRFAQADSSILRSVMVRQCTKIGYKSATYLHLVYLNKVLGLAIAQYVLKLGIARQCFMIGYILMVC